MTRYEWLRWLTFPIMPVHLQTVRRDLRRLISEQSSKGRPMALLDVGGRKSPYTIGVPASVTLLDVPQEEGTKQALNLGFTDSILRSIQQKRSNINNLLIQDMTQSTLTDSSYDAVACIEVIEHVQKDEAFVKNISKVLKKGGWAYFTTPNGDFIKNEGPDKNPDHVRHYTRLEIKALLEAYFETVDVHYAVKTGKNRVKGLESYRLQRPIGIFTSIMANIINRYESKGLEHSSEQTAHLIAVVRKK